VEHVTTVAGSTKDVDDESGDTMIKVDVDHITGSTIARGKKRARGREVAGLMIFSW